MPLFDYQAIDMTGKKIRGVIESENARVARQKLKSKRLMVTAIREKTTQGPSSSGGGSLFGGRINLADISLMTRQLASLVKANVPLAEALNALVEQIEKERFKVILSKVRDDVNEGSSLAKAMAQHPKVFDHIYINMVEAGESSGTLGEVLVKLADLKEAQMRLKGKVQSALTYPAIMLVLAFGLMIWLFTSMVPQMADLLKGNNKPLPLTTEILLKVSEVLVDWWHLILIGIVVGIWLFRRYIETKSGRLRWDRFKLEVAVFGPLMRMVAITRFANVMSTMLASGVPILSSMNIARNLVGNIHIERAIDTARENITEGQSIAEPLKRSGEFPPLVIHMISIGERTGELPEMLQNVANTFEEQVDSKIQSLTSLLEPFMMIFMGGMVMLIVLAVFLPVMEMSNIS